MADIEKAKRLIGGMKGKTLSPPERRDRAISLAELILREALGAQTASEKKVQDQLAGMLNDPEGKAFTRDLTDQCFRSESRHRIGDQMVYLIKTRGIPQYLSWFDRFKLSAFKLAPDLFVPMAKKAIRKQMSTVIIPDEEITSYLAKRKKGGVRINLNHLGEAILGEREADRKLDVYLVDLARDDVDYISVKISTIGSQLNLLAWEETIELLAGRLRALYRAAQRAAQGKFVNLDMEEYRDLHLTVDLFRRVLDEPEFFDTSAGIVLQAYLPDSYVIQQELTEWAMARVARGGAPVKLRIVKGANLAMESVESSIEAWTLPVYGSKREVDANYKRMVTYAFEPRRAEAIHIGIASHNLFDIAYALLLRAEKGVEKWVEFEMLEGMAPHQRRIVQMLAGQILLYSPTAVEEEFHVAVAYLIRRLDENTGPENFLRHAFHMRPGDAEWKEQARRFSEACDDMQKISSHPRREQNRFIEPQDLPIDAPFANEPNTDLSLPHHRRWCEEIVAEWKEKAIEPIQAGLGEVAKGFDPSHPDVERYTYTLAGEKEVEQILKRAKWQAPPIEERRAMLFEVAKLMRRRRRELVGAMILDGGKLIPEADREVSEAIDFIEYYRRRIGEFEGTWKPKGCVLVTPPWNFPCAIPTGGISASLAAGNAVIFKPAPEVPLIGWILASIFWDAGVPKDALQYLNCADEPTGSLLIKDPRVDAIVLTGSTETAKLFMKMRPGIDLLAETGGKNAIIVSDLADRDLAIKDIVQSAFGHSGQKCSACSLAILHKEIYDDPRFLNALADAAASLKVGPAWDLATRVNPLIAPPNPDLKRALTTLEPGEKWLLKPEEHTPYLWSPGIKIEVREGSYTHRTEFFGPVLAVIRAENFDHALHIANATRYGLTSGLQSLDQREIGRWSHEIQAGNLYVNRGITGAIVQRQPFGGCKASSFGKGAKAGGPNYLIELMEPENIPACEDYDAVWREMRVPQDPTRLLGQDNLFCYVPHERVVLFGDVSPRAAKACGCPIDFVTDEKELLKRLEKRIRVRMLEEASERVKQAAAKSGSHIASGPILGRYEILHYVRETALSIDYHRYGNLGLRETGE